MGQSIAQMGASTQPQGKGGFGGAPTPMQESTNPMQQPGMGAMQGKGGMGSPMPEQKQAFEGSRMAPTRPQFGQPNPYTNTTPEMGNPQMMSGMQGGQAGGKGQPMMPQGKGQ
jgi:hypothetical protein